MRTIRRSSFTVSSFALAIGLLGSNPASAQTVPVPAPAPAPESCANIKNEEAKQACSNDAKRVDPLANQGETETSPTQGGVASAEPTPGGRGEIVVTGSRLRRDERSSADPLTVIDPNVQNREGKLDTAEILQTSPIAAGSTQITSAISSNFVVNGGEGVQTISLRGLGANRTLVLLNGRRAGPAGVRGGVSAFDLNVIPQDVIQSVEILKTGASSIYGSDAIAGVVNLITKKDLRGLNVRGFASVPTRSGGEQYNASASYGLGLGDRGHASISVGYNKFNELERGDRSFLGCEEENVTNVSGQRVDPIDPRTGQAYCGAFLNNSIQLVTAGANNLFGPCVTALPGVAPARGCAAGTVRRAIGGIQFDPTLAQYLSSPSQVGLFFTGPATGLTSTSFRAPAGFFPAGSFTAQGLALQNNYDTRVDNDSVIPRTTRFTVYGEAGYDLTDDVNLYFEGLYNRRKTKTDASRQLFFFQYPGCFRNTNPCPAALQGDPLNTGFTGYAYLEPVIYAPFNSSTDVKYFRGLGGAHANLDRFLPHGFADFYFQHSRSNGNYNRDIIFRDAIEQIDPTLPSPAELRTELCAGTLTAIRHVPCIDINYTDPRVLRGDFTDQERAFLFGVDRGRTKYRQNTAELSFGGDLFNLPGGAIKFALGAQYRRDSINDTPGEASLTDNLFASTSSGITAGHQTTQEVFGETEFPILKDIPFVRELTVNAAGRYTSAKSVRSSDGASDTDHAFTYKVGAVWRPVTPLKFRATYGTSFRSPALFEQFLADESGFAAASSDPCSNLQLQENQRIVQNCTSQGIPLTFIPTSSIESFSGGGIGVLNPEKSKALTLSAIVTPDGWFWGGGQFSFAVDYIDIKVRNQVTQLGAANILRGCYTSDAFPTDPLCSLFTRAPAGAANQFQVTSLRDPFINIDTEHNKSIDFTTRFRQDLGSLGTLSLLGQATYQVRDKFKLFANTPLNTNGEAGDPKWVGDLNVTWTKAPFTVTYGFQYISGTNDIRNLRRVGGTALNSDNCLNTAAAVALRGGPYCPIYKLPAVAYHSLSFELQATKDISFLVGMANIFDKKPPLVSTVGAPISAFAQVPTLGSYYDYLGRRLFVTARAKLGNFGF